MPGNEMDSFYPDPLTGRGNTNVSANQNYHYLDRMYCFQIDF